MTEQRRITDELRYEVFYAPMEPDQRGRFNAIADRIDAELTESYAALPKDADGEYIHIGDRMENNERVARIVLTDDSWEPSVYLEKLPNVLHEYFCNEISHYHAPTVEDVLREFALAVCKDEALTIRKGVVEEYAAKLRLADDGREQ